MTAEILFFTGASRIDLPVEKVLAGANEADLASVVICGYRKDGSFFTATSHADGGDCLWSLRMCERALMKAVDKLEAT
jgi:hypothetical protein